MSLLLSSGTLIKAFQYHFDQKMSKQIKDISLLTMASRAHTIFNFSHTPSVFQRAVEVGLSLKSKRESQKEKGVRQLTFNARHNTTSYYKHIQAHQHVQTGVNRCPSRFGPP